MARYTFSRKRQSWKDRMKLCQSAPGHSCHWFKKPGPFLSCISSRGKQWHPKQAVDLTPNQLFQWIKKQFCSVWIKPLLISPHPIHHWCQILVQCLQCLLSWNLMEKQDSIISILMNLHPKLQDKTLPILPCRGLHYSWRTHCFWHVSNEDCFCIIVLMLGVSQD